MIAIPILCAAFALTSVVQVTDGVYVTTYGGTCTFGTDVCTVVGATCRAETTCCATKCLCDTTKHVVNGTSNICICETGYSGVVPNCTGNVGSACAANAECLASGYCGSDKMCACKPTHTRATGATSCTAIAIAGTCTASGGECGGLTNAYCNTGVAAPVCACATIYPTGILCMAKTCTSGGTECTSVDPNSQCTSSSCGCKTNYGIFTTGTKATCQPGVGAACTASGGECANLPGGYCNVAVCACGAIYTAAAPACTTKACEPGSTTCSSADSNSECGKGYCVCKSGMSIGSNGKCQLGSGATAVIVSMLLLIASVLAGRMM